MSLQLKLLDTVLRLTAKRKLRAARSAQAMRREMARQASWVVKPPPQLLMLRVAQVGACPVWSVRSGNGIGIDHAVLYLHGGGYVAGSPDMYRGLTGRLSRLSQLEVFLPDYRLAPEAPAPAAFEDALAVWDWMLSLGYTPERIVIAGDSAGGGLSLALLAALCARGTPPAGVIAFSPWTDLTGRSESLKTNAQSDVLLPVERLDDLRGYVLRDLSPQDPRVSPLFADFPGAPPVLIQHSMVELLCDDALHMADRLRAFGADVTVQSWPDTPHVWHLCDGLIPEARAALEDAAAAARRMLNLPAR